MSSKLYPNSEPFPKPVPSLYPEQYFPHPYPDRSILPALSPYPCPFLSQVPAPSQFPIPVGAQDPTPDLSKFPYPDAHPAPSPIGSIRELLRLIFGLLRIHPEFQQLQTISRDPPCREICIQRVCLFLPSPIATTMRRRPNTKSCGHLQEPLYCFPSIQEYQRKHLQFLFLRLCTFHFPFFNPFEVLLLIQVKTDAGRSRTCLCAFAERPLTDQAPHQNQAGREARIATNINPKTIPTTSPLLRLCVVHIPTNHRIIAMVTNPIRRHIRNGFCLKVFEISPLQHARFRTKYR